MEEVSRSSDQKSSLLQKLLSEQCDVSFNDYNVAGDGSDYEDDDGYVDDIIAVSLSVECDNVWPWGGQGTDIIYVKSALLLYYLNMES